MDQRQEATGFFSVIKRHSELDLNSSKCSNAAVNSTPYDLYAVPYSEEYKTFLLKAADLLHKAGDMTSTPRYGFNGHPPSFRLLESWKFIILCSDILCVV